MGNEPNRDLWRSYFGLNYTVTVNHHVLNYQNGATLNRYPMVIFPKITTRYPRYMQPIEYSRVVIKLGNLMLKEIPELRNGLYQSCLN